MNKAWNGVECGWDAWLKQLLKSEWLTTGAVSHQLLDIFRQCTQGYLIFPTQQVFIAKQDIYFGTFSKTSLLKCEISNMKLYSCRPITVSLSRRQFKPFISLDFALIVSYYCAPKFVLNICSTLLWTKYVGFCVHLLNLIKSPSER